MSLTRHSLREKSLQILYAYELTGDPIEQIMHYQLAEINKPVDIRFCEKLVVKTIENNQYYDTLIQDTVENWDIERIALLDSIIIKMCITEFLFFEEIPTKVSINEYIEIAKDFSTVNSGKFVNGVLDAILAKLLSENKIMKKGKGLLNSSTRKD
ncbi:MAG: transcription antitermination factor NusB [Ignavibacteria bacterium]|nr:transcription antitermination factor NusB [Ignavibacteria bacterium]